MMLGVDHLQQQALSPRLMRAVRLLQLSSLDFAREVQDALGNNPFLESDESDNDAATDERNPAAGIERAFGEENVQGATADIGEFGEFTAVDAGEHAVESGSETESASQSGSDRDSAFDDEHENWQSDGISGPRRNNDGEATWQDLRAVEESLGDTLCRQLGLLPLSERDKLLAGAIVGSLDDDGYLRVELAELAAIIDADPPPAVEELQVALSLVQSLEPAGVGARTVQECLRLQLPAIESEEQRKLAGRIIDDYLDALVDRDVPGLARGLSRTPGEIQTVLAEIRRLDPRPGTRFGAPHVQYVMPDVIVRKIRGTWTATLNPAVVPKVHLNRVYAEMFQRARNAQHAELASHLQEARWTVSNIEQRFATILSVAQAIVSRQHHFFEYGALAMKPLGLREIADAVGVHESTVSRVTNNKFMATPLGVFELKYFFSRAMATASGGACSATAIRGLITDMIEAEQSQAPLSDAEIARQLARQGLVVARRTVTKYRQALRIDAYERRRAHA
jgi:RNA polymerase sigma-54 factor